MATALPILDIQEPGADLARMTVFIKLHLGLLGNSREVSSSLVEVDADKVLIRVAKTLLDSPELQAIRTLDGDLRRFLYDSLRHSRFSAIVVRRRMPPGVAASRRLGTPSSGEDRDDRKRPKRQEISRPRHGITRCKIPANCHPRNPQPERELG
jgi:hypothetical protein